MSPDELARCAATLRELVADAGAFLDKQAPSFAALAEVRREANRLIEAVKGNVRIRRRQSADSTADAPPAPQPANDQPRRAKVVPSLAVPSGVCYSCESRIEEFHSHYTWMCQACGDLNWQKREQQADLSGRTALVTGGRVRIGFQTCLKLLRAGAMVHAVTRFPHDAAERFAGESDFDSWRDRLTIHALDLCNLPAVERFAARMADNPLDILINNAAQTIRPTREFFAHMITREAHLGTQLSSGILTHVVPNQQGEPAHTLTLARGEPGDANAAVGTFLDQRISNSWTARIGDIAPVETLEVHFINAIAPFLLIQGLLPAMRNSPWPRRFIVNVAAREGQFAGKTSPRHPHTNMAKAALNMLTRSLAGDLRKQAIYINSVDPGWVSDQRPFPAAEQTRIEAGDWLPLDDVDAAARLLDLVFVGAHSDEPPVSGRLWRNYRACEW